MTMLHDITGSVPRNKQRTRKGRGKSAGKGKTAGRGTKGSGAHGGDVHWTPGHEGGQTPLFRRWPKRGFSNFKFETKYHVVNVDMLNAFDDGATVDGAMLIEAGLIPDAKQPLKVLGDGSLKKKLTVVGSAFSKSALAKIQALGGAAQNLKGEAYTPRKQKPPVDPLKQWERKQSGGKKAAAPVVADAAPAEAKPTEVKATDEKPAEESN